MSIYVIEGSASSIASDSYTLFPAASCENERQNPAMHTMAQWTVERLCLEPQDSQDLTRAHVLRTAACHSRTAGTSFALWPF